jgi:DNA-binding transcriptional ArsR family regulator
MSGKGRIKDSKDGLERKLRQVMDPAVAKALSHPLRSHILVTLGDRIASPTEIARELGLAARDLDYHVKVLTEIGMIRLVRTEQRRGVQEHFYELARPILNIDDQRWRGIPAEIRGLLSTSLLQLTVDDALAALRAGTFNARDSHQSRTSMILDEQGWADVTGVMRRALEEMLGVRRESERRQRASTGRGIPVEVVMMGFETAAGNGRAVGTGSP